MFTGASVLHWPSYKQWKIFRLKWTWEQCNWRQVVFYFITSSTRTNLQCGIFLLFYVWVSVHRKSILYKEPTRCNFGSIVYWSLQDYSTCFGRFLRPSSGVLKTVAAATGACHGSGWYISRSVATALSCSGNRPWTFLLDIGLLVTARLLYMFRALSASIIRSTKNCSSSHWCMSWVGMIYIQEGSPRSVATAVATSGCFYSF